MSKVFPSSKPLIKSSAFSLDIVLLATLTIILFFYNIWSGSLRDWDEAIYAQVAKEYFQNNSWLQPTFNGELWFHKPPFVMWFMRIGYSIWGIGELPVRIGPAICGAVTILITYRFTKERFGKGTAILASLILLGIPHYVAHAKMGMLDVPLTLMIQLSLLSYLKGKHNPRWFLAAGAAFGTGFMIKGIAVCVVPVAIIAHIALFHEYKHLRSKYFWAGIGLSLLMFAPWHMVQTWQYGMQFWNDYFVYHVVTRGTSAIEGHSNNVFYYFGTLFREAKPWFLPGFIAIPYCILIAKREKNRALAIIVCWICSIFVITAAFSTKLDWYIMPLYPAMSICIAIMLTRLIPARHLRKVTALACAIIILNGIFCHKIFDLDYSSEIKSLSNIVSTEIKPEESLYIYNINGPAAKFYIERNIIGIKPEHADIENRDIWQKGSICLLTRERYIDQVKTLISANTTETIASNGTYFLIRLTGNW